MVIPMLHYLKAVASVTQLTFSAVYVDAPAITNAVTDYTRTGERRALLGEEGRILTPEAFDAELTDKAVRGLGKEVDLLRGKISELERELAMAAIPGAEVPETGPVMTALYATYEELGALLEHVERVRGAKRTLMLEIDAPDVKSLPPNALQVWTLVAVKVS
jgi:hypothetical protein